jgi:hypothetical protein
MEDANLAKCRHATPRLTMVTAAMMQKVLHNNTNGKKLDLNEFQIATRHTRIHLSM